MGGYKELARKQTSLRLVEIKWGILFSDSIPHRQVNSGTVCLRQSRQGWLVYRQMKVLKCMLTQIKTSEVQCELVSFLLMLVVFFCDNVKIGSLKCVQPFWNNTWKPLKQTRNSFSSPLSAFCQNYSIGISKSAAVSSVCGTVSKHNCKCQHRSV